MKKTLIFTFGLFLALVGMMSCGDGGAAEARAKAIADSLKNDSIMRVNAAAEAARMDSMAAVAAADSARAQALADSLAAVEASKGKGGKKPVIKKPVPTPTPQPTPTPTPTPKTGKDAIKGDLPKTGKDAIKSTGDAPKTGKDAIKGK